MRREFIVLISFILISCSTTNVKTNDGGLIPKNGKSPTYCEQIVSVHGLLTRAQAECGYNKYSNDLINDSRKCMQHELGEDHTKEILVFGMAEFDRNMQEVGKQSICQNILKEFPNYISN